jgi:hypothetical protein
MSTNRKRKFTVTITSGDRSAVQVAFQGSLEEINLRAVARAAGRDVLRSSTSTFEALDCLTSEIPDATIFAWVAKKAKRAA